jgi:hypothetical protein
MKNAKVFLTALLFSTFIFSGCDKNVDLTATEQIMIRNSWSVDYFFTTADMTGDYADGKILFSSTGAVGYQKGGVTTPGTWTKSVDGSNTEWYSIQFNTNDPAISKLTKAWKLTERMDNSLQFEGTDSTTNTVFRIKID